MAAREGNASRRIRRGGNQFNEFMAGVGRRVAWLRTKAGFTQEALADFAGIDLTSLQRIERGDANPTTLTWCDLAQALDVQPHQLLRPRREQNPQRRGPGRPPKKRTRG